jgi:hypothetical protein
MKKKLALMGLLLCLAASPAWGLRCGNQLVDVGDYQFTVFRKCGSPLYTNHRIEYRVVRWYNPGLDWGWYNRWYNPGVDWERYIPVEVEEWFYDFGATRFMQLLRFENGRLVYIQSLGYGAD